MLNGAMLEETREDEVIKSIVKYGLKSELCLTAEEVNRFLKEPENAKEDIEK